MDIQALFMMQAAFEHTAAHQYPTWFFEGEEFAWANSAYSLTPCTIPVHKEPASLQQDNTVFDKAVSHLCVRSDHCMGALKDCFSMSLWFNVVQINSNQESHCCLSMDHNCYHLAQSSN